MQEVGGAYHIGIYSITLSDVGGLRIKNRRFLVILCCGQRFQICSCIEPIFLLSLFSKSGTIGIPVSKI